MNATRKFYNRIVLTLMSSVAAPAVFAHPGHVADASLHSLLHAEHVIVLAVAALVALLVYKSRNN